MPIRTRRLAAGALVAALTGSIVVTGVTPAAAAPADCKDVGSIASADLADCIATLHTKAEVAGRAAAKADEAYLQAKQATGRAREQLADADTEAYHAAWTAQRSRARAALVAAQLARGGGGGSAGRTAEVLLSGDGAHSVLYHLSRMSELGADTSTLADEAARDRTAAEAARAQVGLAAERVADSERAARAQFAKAKKRSEAARVLVQRAEAKQDAETSSGGDGGGNEAEYVDLPLNASAGARVVAFARAQIGEPYVFGAAGGSSWDCSGLSMMALGAIGKGIGGHSSNAQYHLAASKGLLLPYSAAQPGDLVFYGSGDMYHVAIYSGGGNMVEAPMPGRNVREVPVRRGDLAPMVARYTG